MSEQLSRRDQFVLAWLAGNNCQAAFEACWRKDKSIKPDEFVEQFTKSAIKFADMTIQELDRTAKPEPVKSGEEYYKAALEQIVKAGDPTAVSTAVAREALAGTWPLVTGPETGGQGK